MVVYGLLGYPLRYSLSPAIHQAAYEALGLEAAYLLWPTEPERLLERVTELRSRSDVGGWNVTVPLKQSIIPLLDCLAPSALAVGAVNTVEKSGGQLIGHNTDTSGFTSSLREAGVVPQGQAALVIGAGGAARAVCQALLDAGMQRLYLLNRTAERAIKLAAELSSSFERSESKACARLPEREARGRHICSPSCSGQHTSVRVITGDELWLLAAQVSLVMNCTSSQNPWESFGISGAEFWSRSSGWAVDLAYGQMIDGFLAEAVAHGWRTLSGEGMLLWQAAHAFSIWTGREAPISEMRRAMRMAGAAQHGT